MLPSEFYERTKVNLTAEEYAKVEHIYNSVLMDKDEFCKLWLKNRDNKLVAELMETIYKYEAVISELREHNATLLNTICEIKEEAERDSQKMSNTHMDEMETLGWKIVTNIENPSNLYSAIEEEFGINFIIKTKLQAGIDLNEDEKAYLVSKL